jgi:curved DNA-binding protein
MAVKFEDYYQTLGVKRESSQEDIQRAFRRLARKYHPDVNKQESAAGRFKQVSEAYEVLKDPEKRSRYDTLGENWEAGQEFRPPPGWEGRFRGGAGGPGGGFQFEAGGQFSDFFEAMFGQAMGQGPGGVGGAGGGVRRPEAQESPITISLHEAFHGSSRQINLQGAGGSKTLEVKIPKGTGNGAKIRLAGEGLILKISVAPDSRFGLSGRDLTMDVELEPWQAALGDQVDVETMDGTVTLSIPAGTGSGQKLRLKGKGLPGQKGSAGDLYVRLVIVVSKELSERERGLYEQLKQEALGDGGGEKAPGEGD